MLTAAVQRLGYPAAGSFSRRLVDLGNVDSGVALVLCDAGIADLPIVYCSEPFTSLTGYSHSEIIGTNCRFLQHPPGRHGADHHANQLNAKARDEVKQKLALGHEARVHFVNFRKDGSEFVNILTLIPISWQGKNYVVGFQADEGSFCHGPVLGPRPRTDP
ncbi:hypothetical protein PZA11_000163 [Diplocarpon coronariae]